MTKQVGSRNDSLASVESRRLSQQPSSPKIIDSKRVTFLVGDVDRRSSAAPKGSVTPNHKKQSDNDSHFKPDSDSSEHEKPPHSVRILI